MFIKKNNTNGLNNKNINDNIKIINKVRLPSIVENNKLVMQKSESTKELTNYPCLKKIKIIK
jgi:hypothetical protein